MKNVLKSVNVELRKQRYQRQKSTSNLHHKAGELKNLKMLFFT